MVRMEKHIIYSPGRNILTEQELAEMLRVSRQTLHRWRSEGMPFMRASRTIRYDYEEVLNWVSYNRSDSCQKAG